MRLELKTRKDGRVGVVEVHGHLIMMHGPELHDTVTKLVSEGCNRLLVDMSGATYVDSFGIGQMVACHKTVHAINGHIRFSGLTPKVLAVVKMCGLPAVLEIDLDPEVSLAKLLAS